MAALSKIGAVAASCLVLLALAAPPAPADEPAVATHHFEAAAVEVVDLAGRLRILPHEEDGIEVTLRGPAELVEAVALRATPERLTLDASAAASSRDGGFCRSVVTLGQTTVVTEGCGSTVVTRGADGKITTHSTVVGGTSGELELELRVPRGLPVAASRIAGAIEVGDLEGPLRVSLLGGRARIGRMGGGRLELVGSGDIAVEEATGDLAVAVTGSGSVSVQGGRVESLEALVQGAGDVFVGGTVQRARLSLTGAGTIEVAELREPPELRITGTGRVRAGRW